MHHPPKPDSPKQSPECKKWKRYAPRERDQEPGQYAFVPQRQQEVALSCHCPWASGRRSGSQEVRDTKADDTHVAHQKPMMDRPAACAESVPLAQQVDTRVDEGGQEDAVVAAEHLVWGCKASFCEAARRISSVASQGVAGPKAVAVSGWGVPVRYSPGAKD